MIDSHEYLEMLAREESGAVASDDVLLINDVSLRRQLKIKVGTVLAGVPTLAQVTLSSAEAVPGSTLTTFLYLDTTAVTGGFYVWNGTSYTKVAT